MLYGRLTVNPISAAWNTVARFDDYADAQEAVDRLSDDGFPVEKLDIIGSELRLVERITGRLTKMRAAAAGGGGGAGVGVLVGPLFGGFSPRRGPFARVSAGAGAGGVGGAAPGGAAPPAGP